jgi:acyl dehydratase
VSRPPEATQQIKTWQVGQELKSLTKPAFTREQLKQYAEASGDKNLIHLEESFAQQAGFPSVIVHGMLSMAYMADHLRFNFPESRYRVLHLKTRFRKVTFPGDQLTCGGAVKKQIEPGKWLVSLWTKNQNGEITTDGEAEIQSGGEV